MKRPTFCTNEHLEFLDNLQDRGVINMYIEAAPYLEAEFGLIRPTAKEILIYWMETFGKPNR